MTESTRRDFVKTSTAAAVGAGLLSSLGTPSGAYAQGEETLKIGLVGCGGRGSKACVQALSTAGNVELVAMGDAFADHLQNSLDRISRAVSKNKTAKVSVDEDHKFVGFDAYQKVLDSGVDLVILATPPGFRPIHFEAAVKAGKHVFMEKPVATDATGVRRVLAAAQEAKKKNLKVGVGLQRHHQGSYKDIIQRVHDGAIGTVTSLNVYWNGGGVWDPRKKREDTKTEMEYQLRNWYYYNWICGDHIVEQHIHNLDVGCWAKGGMYPVKANGMGGREVRTDPKYGEIFDHHAVEYTFEDGTKMYSQCRHIKGCWNSVSEHAIGTKGMVSFSGRSKYKTFDGDEYSYRGPKDDPYQVEHDDLFNAIRTNTSYSEAEYGAMSTMTAILGRMATYSGKELNMEKALASTISVMPKEFSWDAEMPSNPDPQTGEYPVPVPGIYKAY